MKRPLKYYAAKYSSRKYKGIIFEDYNSTRCRKFLKNKNLKYKVFESSEEAIAYLGLHKSKIMFMKGQEERAQNCLICEKPFHGKTKLCPSCNRKRKKCSLSVGSAVTLSTFHPGKDIFTLLEQNPYLHSELRLTTKKMRAEFRKARSAELKSDEYQNHFFIKDEKNIPSYIISFMQKHPDKKLQGVEGTPMSLKVYYTCERCGKEQCQDAKKLLMGYGHNCEKLISSGEAVVQSYLDEAGIKYKTQYETLKCTNPITGRIMPYDFQLEDYNIIIEVQGEQHYSYSPYFHGTLENFEYSQWRDKFKGIFAEKMGFFICYIDYDQIASGAFKDIIVEAIDSVRHKK